MSSGDVRGGSRGFDQVIFGEDFCGASRVSGNFGCGEETEAGGCCYVCAVVVEEASLGWKAERWSSAEEESWGRLQRLRRHLSVDGWMSGERQDVLSLPGSGPSGECVSEESCGFTEGGFSACPSSSINVLAGGRHEGLITMVIAIGDGHRFVAVVDSGATRSCVNEAVIRKHFSSLILLPTTETVSVGSGEMLRITSLARLCYSLYSSQVER